MAEPVTPDREALISVAEEALSDWWNDLMFEARPDWERGTSAAVDALLPLLTDALDRARQQGRNEAAAAIEAERERLCGEPWQVCEVYGIAARLARGGPNRKDEE